MDEGEWSTYRNKDRGGCVGVDLECADEDDLQEVARVEVEVVERIFFSFVF